MYFQLNLIQFELKYNDGKLQFHLKMIEYTNTNILKHHIGEIELKSEG